MTDAFTADTWKLIGMTILALLLLAGLIIFIVLDIRHTMHRRDNFLEMLKNSKEILQNRKRK